MLNLNELESRLDLALEKETNVSLTNWLYKERNMEISKEKELEIAIQIASKAHFGQIDKGGYPYIFHALAVMNNVETIEEKIVAVLHDVIEDCEDWTLEKLAECGISENSLFYIDLLTRKSEGIPSYNRYIQQISYYSLAINVKLADLKQNIDITRLKEITEKDISRLKKYHESIQILEEAKLKIFEKVY